MTEPKSFTDTYGDPELSGDWVRRHSAEPEGHRCPLPGCETEGDLWRCGCGRLWRCGPACDMCDAVGHGNPPTGLHTVGRVWRPATLWQRIKHRKWTA